MYIDLTMEGGDNPEQVAQPVIQPESSEPKEPIPDDKPSESTEALTDSILDDDLVVIPSQNEQTEIEQVCQVETEPEQPDTVPSVASPSPAEAEKPATVPASELPAAAAAPAPAAAPPSPSVEIPQRVPPPQPNPEPTRSRTTMAAKPIKAIEGDDDEDFEDETLVERLVGLTEMFPESVRNATQVTLSLSVGGLKKLFNFSKSALWIGSTSFMILILPIVFETEMVHMEQAQIQRQKQILLGPNAATAGAMTGAMTPPIPGVSVAAAPSDSR